jgi:hypothetical protein
VRCRTLVEFKFLGIRVYVCASSPRSISSSHYHWTRFPLCRGRGRVEARGAPCARGRRLGCVDVGWGLGCSWKEAGWALILIFDLYPTSRLMFAISLDLVSISHILSYIPVHLSFPYYALVVGFDSPCMLSSKMYSRLSSLFHYWADPPFPAPYHVHFYQSSTLYSRNSHHELICC